MYNQYNPYMPQQRYQPIEPMQQPQTMQPQQLFSTVQRCSGLSGKVVANESVASGIDIPLDGTCSYFPLADGSAIITKQIQLDGTSKTITYKPVNDEIETPKFVTIEEFNKELRKIDISDLEDQIKDLKAELKELKKKKKEE